MRRPISYNKHIKRYAGNMKRLFVYLLAGISLLIFSVYLGCTNYESPKNMGLNNPSKKNEIKPPQDKQTSFYQSEEKAQKKAQIADAEACKKKFDKCVENCKSSKCEDLCMKSLSACEKYLPVDVQTLKE
jgi:hypothetical protein